MENLNRECSKKGAKYLIVNRNYYQMIANEIAKEKKMKVEEAWLNVIETYKGLIVAVTDKSGFTFKVL